MKCAALVMAVKTNEGNIQTVESSIQAADPRCAMVISLRRDVCPRNGWKHLHQLVWIRWL